MSGAPEQNGRLNSYSASHIAIVLRPNGNETHYQIVMNQEQVQDASGRTMWEIILIEMNFSTGEWRKIKRKRPKPYVSAASASEAAQ